RGSVTGCCYYTDLPGAESPEVLSREGDWRGARTRRYHTSGSPNASSMLVFPMYGGTGLHKYRPLHTTPFSESATILWTLTWPLHSQSRCSWQLNRNRLALRNLLRSRLTIPRKPGIDCRCLQSLNLPTRLLS